MIEARKEGDCPARTLPRNRVLRALQAMLLGLLAPFPAVLARLGAGIGER